ncbi:hypothetical protein [Streptosporangium vulgare]|uniref:hypothetical protein n=1 Tax=Streptosporangium vulgare TaxID=46190 RepID=UPI0031CE4010
MDALEKVAANPIGDGYAVSCGRNSAACPRAWTAQVVVGVEGGKVLHVTSTLSGAPPRRLPPPGSPNGRRCEIAARDGGIDLATAHRQEGHRHGGVPAPDGTHNAFQITPDRRRRGRARRVHDARGRGQRRDPDPREPGGPPQRARTTPAGRRSPPIPRPHYSGTRHPRDVVRQGRSPAATWSGPTRTGKAWDVDHATDTPANTSVSNATKTVENRASGDAFSVGTRTNVTTAEP